MSTHKPDPSTTLALQVLDHLREGCQLIDREYRYLYVNDAAARHGRTTREQLIGRKMMEAYPGIEHTRMYAALTEALTLGRAYTLENEFEYPDGSKTWFELYFEPAPEGVIVLSIDIDARKRAEHALERANNALTLISESNQALVRARSEQEYCQSLCALAVERGGYALAWIGLRSDEGPMLRPVAASGAAIQFFRRKAELYGSSAPPGGPSVRAFRSGKPVVSQDLSNDYPEEPWRDELHAHGLASAVSLPFFVQEQLAGVVSVYSPQPAAFNERELELLGKLARDLGYGVETLRARERAEREADEKLVLSERISKLEARYRDLVENLEDIVFSLDLAGNFTYVSPAVRRYGFEPEALLGKSFESFVHVDDLPALRETVARTMQGAVEPVTYRALDAQGQVRFVRTTGRLLAREGTPVGITGVLADVTELQRAEQQLRVAQKMEAVGQLAGGIAHDFNNLLSVILSYSTLAAETLREGDPLRQDIDEIGHAATRAAALTRQLLAFSRRQVVEPGVINLNRVAAEMENMLHRLLGPDVQVIMDLSPELAAIRADAGQIEQVIMNLAVNARDAMPEGGTLTLRTRNVSPTQVTLRLSDTGVGMSEEIKARLFEPFFTTKEPGRGTGLGLSTVFGIVRQSGGHIVVDSQPGAGSSFEIFFPRAEPKEADERFTPTVVASAAGTETVLVVDDEESVRKLVARILSGAGYRVLQASGAGEAVLMTERHVGEIDLLLTDVVMPQLSGMSLAERLTKIDPTLRVLYMSGYTGALLEQQGLAMPQAQLVQKPFNNDDLARRVRAALDQTRPTAPD